MLNFWLLNKFLEGGRTCSSERVRKGSEKVVKAGRVPFFKTMVKVKLIF